MSDLFALAFLMILTVSSIGIVLGLGNLKER
jgi:hypothetical protein